MKIIQFLLPRMEYVLLAAVFWGIAASGPRLLNFDGDLPRHLLTGELILQNQRVSLIDEFSFRTVGFPSIPHEWLAQVIFFISYKLLGLNGVVLLTALIITATWTLVYKHAFAQSNHLFSALLFTSLAIAASLIHILPRPHLFTYLLTISWILILEQIRNGNTRVRFALPLLMLVWVNLHGMFILGIIILGIFLVGEFLDDSPLTWLSSAKGRSMLVAAALSLIATLFSPSGIKIWETIFTLGGNTYLTARIPEYQSANFHEPETWPFIFMLAIILISFARNITKTSWVDILLVIAFMGIALYTSRMIPLFAIVTAPIGAKALSVWLKQEFSESRFYTLEKNISRINSSSNGLIWLVLLILAVSLLFKAGKAIDPENKGNVFNEQFFPVEATTWLKAHPQRGHVFNEFDWGGYLLLRLWPAHQVFMDGHTHIYGEQLTREYEQVITLGNGWERILTKYKIEWVILRTNAPLITALLSSSDWTITYKDETTVILSRK